jgi:hypothetical protein
MIRDERSLRTAGSPTIICHGWSVGRCSPLDGAMIPG